jgi:hypothetical protein
MAYFAARESKPADYCTRRVSESDVYVGMIGLRYGSPVQDRPDVSYTELEFQAATQAGLPRLVFLLDEDAALPIPAARLLDRDPDLQARQRGFRQRLPQAGIVVAMVTSPEDLEVKLLHALLESRAPSPADGAGQTGDTRRAVNTLPADTAAFTGRQEQLAEIAAAVAGAAQAGKSGHPCDRRHARSRQDDARRARRAPGRRRVP